MHCIAKTLLTELHLAILVPLLCLRNFPPTFLLCHSRAPPRSVATSVSLSHAPRYGACLRMRRATPSAFGRSHTMVVSWWQGWWCEKRWADGWVAEGPRTGDERDGAGFQESENGIPESLILLVNKCLGDSLLVHSYRPSFVSRRHCVLRFYLVFRSNGFWGPSRVASRVPHVPSLSFSFCFSLELEIF